MQVVEATKFIKVGNNLSLDFVNTDIVDNGQKIDLLEKISDLAMWAAAMNLIDAAEAAKLNKDWRARIDGEKLLTEARGFRQILREMCERLTRGADLTAAQIKTLNDYLRENNDGFARIEKGENGFEKKFAVNYREPAQILRVVAESWADLLCFGNLDFLRKCESATCVLYFYDTTKNHKRRWCSMAGCGNRHKAAAFYERKRAKNLAQ